MENSGLYLLENSPEAAEMRAKVRDMLLSDVGNQRLALQLIENGGFHEEFIAPVLAFLLLERVSMDFSNLAKSYKRIWRQIPQKELIAFVEGEIHDFEAYLYPRLVQEWRGIPALQPYWRDLVGCFFLLSGWGEKICAFEKIFPLDTIIQKLDNQNRAYFNDFAWCDLPEALSNVQAPEIILTGNPFDEVQQASWRNYRTRCLVLDNILDIKTVRAILTHFPHAADSTYQTLAGSIKSESHTAQRNDDMETARTLAGKAIQFYRLVSPAGRDKDYYHNRAHAYTNAGRYEIALRCYKHIFQNIQGTHYDCYYNLACTLARLGRRAEMLWVSAQMFTHYRGFIHAVREDNDFEAYWEDADFKRLLQARQAMSDADFDAFIQPFSVPIL